MSTISCAYYLANVVTRIRIILRSKMYEAGFKDASIHSCGYTKKIHNSHQLKFSSMCVSFHHDEMFLFFCC